MMNNKKILVSILGIILLCSFILSCITSCIPTSDGVTYIELDITNATMYVGETLVLTADTDGAEKDIVWTSDATHIAKVEDGVVTAIAPGEVTIKVRVGCIEFSRSCRIY